MTPYNKPDTRKIRMNEMIDRGRLQVQCFDANLGIPLSDVNVLVMSRLNSYLIAQISTNSSGRTQEISLPTPPLEYSLAPGFPQPFSTYDIIATREDLDIIIVEGVQVFPETTAIQNINLRQRKYSYETSRTLFVPYPVLWGNFPPKIPESAIKELPPSSGFVVLSEPVIPETIIVHDGVPSNFSATNYYVPFKDYIKNVASSEIYCTWSSNTIQANVLAILSFTLNRVYTEWYRNKGFDFTITNSTAYDQAFSYGRTIFEEIAYVVDEIFTTYITKPNIRQPLLAQYCDGQRVSCPDWLNQWGSKNMGEQGYSPIDILRYYYGSEVYLAQAQIVEGIPQSFPGVNLLSGSAGGAVRTIQEQLNRISDNYPAIPKIRVDGIFKETTEDAVKRFQEIFQLPVTGIVDFATWYSISNIYVAVTKIGELTP
ncbi:peptidoglycan-binding protein [Sedimentibacter hydroxybenzoicus DSM 7310]|uniref:Peptidoglycan-binding protein n=1 Tax=Sedimentibacter hydroxybenzoicus DSM 7310 TaxID=1123245 RepID=A0A974GY73_SEDHY|nr:peptidoglycan-binding domain-containing protein [Sedimentibacter hydroxybenzoicus]NYB75895.1 peptidoglycan-binding protein [Sedimentibacter hydroxybenzoicus DSM 7310]